jgi:hypothetical protein
LENNMNIEKGYYISSGELTAMYTLNFGHGFHESGDYIVNLSTDAETAVKKAMDYVNAQGDIYPLDTSYADVSLNDIVRRNQEQIEADNLRRKEENIANWIVTSMEVISQGKNPFAKIYASGHVIDHC